MNTCVHQILTAVLKLLYNYIVDVLIMLWIEMYLPLQVTVNNTEHTWNFKTCKTI